MGCKHVICTIKNAEAAQLNPQNLGIAQRPYYAMFTRPFSFPPPHKIKKKVWLRETKVVEDLTCKQKVIGSNPAAGTFFPLLLDTRFYYQLLRLL